MNKHLSRNSQDMVIALLINNHDLPSDIEIFFNFLKKCSLKYRSNECRKLLKSFKKRELKFLGRQA